MIEAPPQERNRPDRPASRVLPLQSGDRLTRAEFERRYELHPEIKKAELIEGVVYVSSPVYIEHGELHFNIAGWLMTYLAHTPNLDGFDNQSIRLDADNELQPDLSLFRKGRLDFDLYITEKGLMEGAPDLIVEVAATSADYDLHDKLHVYRRNGVQEYIIVLAFEQEIRWFDLDEGRYVPLPAGQDHIFRSQAFPGLWLNERAFWADDMAAVLATLQEGMQSDAYLAFREQLEQDGA